ncbi:MAG: RNA polymerase sigma factor [bacterium]
MDKNELPDSDTQFIKEFKSGNKESFSHILKRYKKPLVNFAYRNFGSKEDAEDAVQDILVKVYKALDSYMPEKALSTWIFTIAANQLSNIKRRKKIISFLSFEQLQENREESKINQPAETCRDEKKQEVSQLGADIQEAIFHLPDAQRKAVMLAKYENIPYEEIAKILKTTSGAVKQLIFRAKITLKKRLQKYI